jgi:transcriptional antiterminator RfaH
MRNRKRVRGRYRSLVEPMFPRYLFIQLDDEGDDWGPIRSTIGVANMVRFGMMPARVPDGLVQLLRGREDEQGVQSLPWSRLSKRVTRCALLKVSWPDTRRSITVAAARSG